MRSQPLAAAIVLLAIAIGPFALAQGTDTPKKKKHGKPAASASASATGEPEPTPEPPPPPPPAESASADAAPALPVTPPEKKWDSSDTYEDPARRYYFVGLRYRGDVIPKFLINAFVDGGATIYSNVGGIELDSRKDGFSTVFALSLQDYKTGDLLFLQKNEPQVAGNYSVINSSLNAIYASVDLLWSLPIDGSHHWNFEYGIGVGLGVLFGNLMDNWVYQNASNTGPYVDSSNGKHFNLCLAESDSADCTPGNHSNASVAKVGHYNEPSGIAGPKPILFPMVNFPQLGIRYKPIKEFEARLGVGFSLTGFWFGISGDYGLEKEDASESTKPKRDGGIPGLHGLL
jgi:hypothetical protein